VKNSLIISIFVLVCAIANSATIKGTISCDGELLPFANVWLTSVTDTTDIKFAAISDLNGEYIINDVPSGDYWIYSSSLGYEKKREQIQIATDDTLLVHNIFLQKKVETLSEVTVKGSAVTRLADKEIYVVPKEIQRMSPSALEALSAVPKLKIDPLFQTVKTMNNSSVKILIDGANATEKDLLSLRPEDVVKIEYYDLPPARFALQDVSACVNVVTRTGYIGGSVGCTLLNGLNAEMFNDGVYANFNRGKSRLGFYYYFGRRATYNRVLNQEFQYSMNGNDITDKYEGSPSKFLYNNHNIKLNFSQRNDEKYTFNIQGQVKFFNDNIEKKQTLLNSPVINFTSWKSDYVNPSLDFYFSRIINKKHTISLNLTPAYFDAKSHQISRLDSTNQNLISQEEKVKSQKGSIIAELLHEYSLASVKLESGVSYNTSKTKQSYTLQNNDINYSEIYLFSSIVGRKKWFSYSMGLGFSHMQNSNLLDNEKYSFNVLRPNVNLSSNINDKNTVRLSYSINPNTPDISELNNIITFSSPILGYLGNPSLKPFYTHSIRLSHYFDSPKIKINPEVKYNHSIKPIVQQYGDSLSFFYTQMVNGKFKDGYGASLGIQFFPFGSQKLMFYVLGTYNYDRIETENYTSNLENAVLMFSTQYMYKNFVFFAQIGTKEKSLSGQNITNYPSNSFVGLMFIKPNYSVMAYLYNPFMKYVYSTESCNYDLLKYKNTTNWKDDSNMVLIRFTYNFKYGATYKEIERKLENIDTDSGIKHRAG
jgi:hypothetical protein